MKHRGSVILPIAMTLATLSVAPAMAASDNVPGTSGANPQMHSGQIKSGTPNYSKPMGALLEAAQRLRDATHTMAARNDRAEAIRQTNDALIATQRAMVDLPYDLQHADKSVTFDQKAMHRLREAAQRLRDSAQALADKPASKDRNTAIRQINRALWESQEAMVALLGETGSTADKAESDMAGGKTASSGTARSPSQ